MLELFKALLCRFKSHPPLTNLIDFLQRSSLLYLSYISPISLLYLSYIDPAGSGTIPGDSPLKFCKKISLFLIFLKKFLKPRAGLRITCTGTKKSGIINNKRYTSYGEDQISVVHQRRGWKNG